MMANLRLKQNRNRAVKAMNTGIEVLEALRKRMVPGVSRTRQLEDGGVGNAVNVKGAMHST